MLTDCRRVQDVGCGVAQTLLTTYPARVTFGLDIDRDALKLGKSLTDRTRFVCGRAEALPWSNAQFDMVIARVSLAYTNINASLREIHRVLRRGGHPLMALHPLFVPWGQARGRN